MHAWKYLNFLSVKLTEATLEHYKGLIFFLICHYLSQLTVMELHQILNIDNFILVFKILIMLAALFTNLTLFVKVMSRPSIQTIFNVSVACLFGLTAFFGPFVVYFYLPVFSYWTPHWTLLGLCKIAGISKCYRRIIQNYQCQPDVSIFLCGPCRKGSVHQEQV